MGLKLSSAIGFAECVGFFVGCHWMEELLSKVVFGMMNQAAA